MTNQYRDVRLGAGLVGGALGQGAWVKTGGASAGGLRHSVLSDRKARYTNATSRMPP